MPATNQAALDAAKNAVVIALGLVGPMALWLGFMRVLREAGFMRSIARAARAGHAPALPRRAGRAPGDGRDDPEPVGERARARQRGDPVRAEGDARARDAEPAPGRGDERDGALPGDQHLRRRGAPARRRSRSARASARPNAAGIVVPTLLATPCSTVVGGLRGEAAAGPRAASRSERAAAREAAPDDAPPRLRVDRRASQRPSRAASARAAERSACARLALGLFALLARTRRQRARAGRRSTPRRREAGARQLAPARADGRRSCCSASRAASTVYDAFIAARARASRSRS